jgi:hypothetical protein
MHALNTAAFRWEQDIMPDIVISVPHSHSVDSLQAKLSTCYLSTAEANLETTHIQHDFSFFCYSTVHSDWTRGERYICACQSPETATEVTQRVGAAVTCTALAS